MHESRSFNRRARALAFDRKGQVWMNIRADGLTSVWGSLVGGESALGFEADSTSHAFVLNLRRAL
jgi:hypothetical protein